MSDEMLAELAAITWLIDAQGRIIIEGKSDVKAALGHSPDLAEALMIAIGEGVPVPFAYTGIKRGDASTGAKPTWLAQAGYRESADEAMRNFTEDQIGARRRSPWDSFAPRMGSWGRQRGY